VTIPLRAVDFERRELRLLKPLRTAHGSIPSRSTWLLRLEDADGRVGWGEAAPLASAGTEGRLACGRALEVARQILLDGVLDGHEAGAWEPALLGALPGTPAVRYAVDLALWDLAARRAEVPLAALLSADSSIRVPVSALVSDAPSAAAAARVGFGSLKVKVAVHSVEEDRERLESIRAAAPGLAIRLDANAGWANSAEAAAALDRLGCEGVTEVEQPVPVFDAVGMKWLRRRVPPRIAADESVSDEAAGLRIVADDSADLLVLKPVRLGGLGPCLRLAAAARDAALDVFTTTMLEGAVGRAGTLHLAAALHREGGPVHGLATGALLAEDHAVGPAPERGLLAVPEGPGLGVAP